MKPSADNIATFVEVIRQQGLSAAARRLGLPKSTVSRRLARLEQQLDTKLLHRSARGITLTGPGRSFYASAVSAVDALDAAVTALSESSKEPRGTIRLTAPPDLGRMLLSPMFVAFLEQYEEISLDLIFTNRFVDLVQEGVDLAVRAGRMTKGDLIARKLSASELHLAAAQGTSVPADDLRALAARPFVLYRASGGAQTLRIERVTGKRRQSLELNVSGRLNVDDYAAMAEMVSAGHGFGLLPSLHVQDGIRAGKLMRIYPDWTCRLAQIYLVYPTRRQPERVRLLADFLLHEFAKLGHV